MLLHKNPLLCFFNVKVLNMMWPSQRPQSSNELY